MFWPNSRGAGCQPATKQLRFRRRGQSLIEFALVALVTYLLLAAIITFGFLFYAAQGTQTTADFLAREISRTPLPANTMRLEDVLRADPDTFPGLSDEDRSMLRRFRAEIYDESKLVLFRDGIPEDPGPGPTSGSGTSQSLEDQIVRLPLINRQLVQLMIPDEIGGQRVLRYPGAVFSAVAVGAPRYTVAIPIVVSRGEFGVETIRLVPVVEPIIYETAETPDAFKISSPQRGIVALRINYPVQSSALSAYQPTPLGGPPNVVPYAADDNVDLEPNPNFTIAGTQVNGLLKTVNSQGESIYTGAHGGAYGLGSLGAMGSVQLVGTGPDGQVRPVRPFRRVISAQAIYRREIFN